LCTFIHFRKGSVVVIITKCHTLSLYVVSYINCLPFDGKEETVLSLVNELKGDLMKCLYATIKNTHKGGRSRPSSTTAHIKSYDKITCQSCECGGPRESTYDWHGNFIMRSCAIFRSIGMFCGKGNSLLYKWRREKEVSMDW